MIDRRDLNRPNRRQQPRGGGRRQQDPPAEWVTVTDYAKRYGASRGQVYKWLKANVLLTYTMGPLRRIRNLPPNEHAALLARDR